MRHRARWSWYPGAWCRSSRDLRISRRVTPRITDGLEAPADVLRRLQHGGRGRQRPEHRGGASRSGQGRMDGQRIDRHRHGGNGAGRTGVTALPCLAPRRSAPVRRRRGVGRPNLGVRHQRARRSATSGRVRPVPAASCPATWPSIRRGNSWSARTTAPAAWPCTGSGYRGLRSRQASARGTWSCCPVIWSRRSASSPGKSR